MTGNPSSEVAEEHCRAIAAHFDAAYYLSANPDVGHAGLDALTHYVLYGWRERRNPSRAFDVTYYLAQNSDVAAAGIDPLLHYVLNGRNEGRLPVRPLDAYRRQLSAAEEPRRKAAGWARSVDVQERLAPAEIAASLRRAVVSSGLVLSFSHDDYVCHTGGVQNLIGDEQRAFTRAGWRYLHLSPASPLPVLAEPTAVDAALVVLRLDGALIGTAAVADLVDALGMIRRHHVPTRAAVHHLMGHAPELVLLLIQASGAATTVVWTHDFFTLCPSYALMRNDVVYCGAPPAASAACGVCCYGSERQGHLARIRAFFMAVRPVVLAPSASMLERWLQRSDLPHADAIVQPLARLVLASAETAGDRDRPLRIAHLGARVFHKGWPVFEELALRRADDPRYMFLQLGEAAGPAMPRIIRNVPVRVKAGARHAMIEAIAEANIDVVINWSLWPETFCYAVHEALAGGAFVVARRDAGNVWPAVAANAPAQGHVVADNEALFALFEGDELIRRVSRSSRRRGALILGNGTFDWSRRSHPTAGRAIESAAESVASGKVDEAALDG